jgi:hypothetical protein
MVQQSFRRLIPGFWNSGETVNFVYTISKGPEFPEYSDRGVIVETSWWYYNLKMQLDKDGIPDKSRLGSKNWDPSIVKLAVFPLHMGGNHWAVGCLNYVDFTIAYLDSLGSRIPAELCENIFAILSKQHELHRADSSSISSADWVSKWKTIEVVCHTTPNRLDSALADEYD